MGFWTRDLGVVNIFAVLEELQQHVAEEWNVLSFLYFVLLDSIGATGEVIVNKDIWYLSKLKD